jgi:hypothetical protein
VAIVTYDKLLGCLIVVVCTGERTPLEAGPAQQPRRLGGESEVKLGAMGVAALIARRHEGVGG